MASPAEKLSLFLLLTLFSSLHTHARDSQFFNKIPSTTNNAVVPTNKEAPINQQEPNFLPQNENSYGLYGHESGQDPPSAADTTTTTNAEFKQPLNKYLPKNYNPVAYVTQPEDVNEGGNAFTEERTLTTTTNNNKNNYYNNDNNNAQNYYNNQQQQEEEATEFRSYPTAANNKDNGADNFYYSGGSSFNSQPQRDSAATFDNRGFQPQGMSDTRYVENGKYFYDINSEKYSRNHPYQSLRGVQAQNEFNSKNFYRNNANEFDNRNFYANDEFNAENSMGGYQEFQNEDNLP